MLKKILVCLDGSKYAEGILPYAIERANRFHSEIILLRVIDTPISACVAAIPAMTGQFVPVVAQPHLDGIIRQDEIKNMSYLKKIASRLENIGLDTESVTLRRTSGETIGDAIIRYAMKDKVDLIMMAIRKHNAWRRFVFGSVTESVIRKSVLPVLVVSPRTHQVKESTLENIPQISPA